MLPSPWGGWPGDHLPPFPSPLPPPFYCEIFPSQRDAQRIALQASVSQVCRSLAFCLITWNCFKETKVTSNVTGAVTPSLRPRPPLWCSCCCGCLCPVSHVVCTSGSRRACILPAFVSKDAVSERSFLRAPFGALRGSLGSMLLSAVPSVGSRDHTLVRQTLNG